MPHPGQPALVRRVLYVIATLQLAISCAAIADNPQDTNSIIPTQPIEEPSPIYEQQGDEWCPNTPTAKFGSTEDAEEFGRSAANSWNIRINGSEVALIPPGQDKDNQWEATRLAFKNSASSAKGYKNLFDDADGFKVHSTGEFWHDTYNAIHWKTIKACDGQTANCYRGILPGSLRRVVAVLDHGVANHIDLPVKITRYELQAEHGQETGCAINGCCPAKEPFLISEHATQVAGLIGALSDGHEGIIGLGAVKELISIRVRLAEGGCIRRDYVERGIRCAAKLGADVINMSFGSVDDAHEPTNIKKALEYVQNQTLAVTSAGNGCKILGTPGAHIWPANFQLDNLITAEARTAEGRFDGSNYNANRIHLAAPAPIIGPLYSTASYSYKPFGQSSAAAALVSAAATLVWSHPNYSQCTPAQLRNVLIRNGQIMQKEKPDETICMVQLDFLSNTVEVAESTGLPLNKCLNLTTPAVCGQ